MKPYFDTSHAGGPLLLIAVLGWAMIEISHLGHSRQGATKVGGAGRRYAAWPFLVAASVMLYLAPHIVPVAAIRPGAVAFGIGMVMLLAGLASANLVGLAAMAVLPLAGVLLQIRTEERALLVTLGEPYRAYATHHKRLVPLVW